MERIFLCTFATCKEKYESVTNFLIERYLLLSQKNYLPGAGASWVGPALFVSKLGA